MTTEPWTPADRYQKRLSKLIQTIRPSVVVETGFDTGVSAEWILRALDANNHGALYSIEAYSVQTITHPRFNFVKGLSYDVMMDLFLETGPWDLFIHDSDHGVACQTFEYELAWAFVSPGGHIATDDYIWGSPKPHMAWDNFCKRHLITETVDLGSARYFKKPNREVPVSGDRLWSQTKVETAKRLSNAASVLYGDTPHFL